MVNYTYVGRVEKQENLENVYRLLLDTGDYILISKVPFLNWMKELIAENKISSKTQLIGHKIKYSKRKDVVKLLDPLVENKKQNKEILLNATQLRNVKLIENKMKKLFEYESCFFPDTVNNLIKEHNINFRFVSLNLDTSIIEWDKTSQYTIIVFCSYRRILTKNIQFIFYEIARISISKLSHISLDETNKNAISLSKLWYNTYLTNKVDDRGRPKS